MLPSSRIVAVRYAVSSWPTKHVDDGNYDVGTTCYTKDIATKKELSQSTTT